MESELSIGRIVGGAMGEVGLWEGEVVAAVEYQCGFGVVGFAFPQHHFGFCEFLDNVGVGVFPGVVGVEFAFQGDVKIDGLVILGVGDMPVVHFVVNRGACGGKAVCGQCSP